MSLRSAPSRSPPFVQPASHHTQSVVYSTARTSMPFSALPPMVATGFVNRVSMHGFPRLITPPPRQKRATPPFPVVIRTSSASPTSSIEIIETEDDDVEEEGTAPVNNIELSNHRLEPSSARVRPLSRPLTRAVNTKTTKKQAPKRYKNCQYKQPTASAPDARDEPEKTMLLVNPDMNLLADSVEPTSSVSGSNTGNTSAASCTADKTTPTQSNTESPVQTVSMVTSYAKTTTPTASTPSNDSSPSSSASKYQSDSILSESTPVNSSSRSFLSGRSSSVKLPPSPISNINLFSPLHKARNHESSQQQQDGPTLEIDSENMLLPLPMASLLTARGHFKVSKPSRVTGKSPRLPITSFYKRSSLEMVGSTPTRPTAASNPAVTLLPSASIVCNSYPATPSKDLTPINTSTESSAGALTSEGAPMPNVYIVGTAAGNAKPVSSVSVLKDGVLNCCTTIDTVNKVLPVEDMPLHKDRSMTVPASNVSVVRPVNAVDDTVSEGSTVAIATRNLVSVRPLSKATAVIQPTCISLVDGPVSAKSASGLVTTGSVSPMPRNPEIMLPKAVSSSFIVTPPDSKYVVVPASSNSCEVIDLVSLNEPSNPKLGRKARVKQEKTMSKRILSKKNTVSTAPVPTTNKAHRASSKASQSIAARLRDSTKSLSVVSQNNRNCCVITMPVPAPRASRKAYSQAVYQKILSDWQETLNRQREGKDAYIFIENVVDQAQPPSNFVYITSSFGGKDIPRPDSTALVGCHCKICTESSKDCCPYMAGHGFAYNLAGKIKIPNGFPIYECNIMCSCSSGCYNRVVQKGRQFPVCIFRTNNGRGWGVRSCCSIKRGTFVTEYVGELITTDEAERRGQKYDQEGVTYLFDLDFNEQAAFTVDAKKHGNISHFFNHSVCGHCIELYAKLRVLGCMTIESLFV